MKWILLGTALLSFAIFFGEAVVQIQRARMVKRLKEAARRAVNGPPL